MLEQFRLINNPLTVIGLFAGIAEIAMTVTIALVGPEDKKIFVWFVMLFPIVLVSLFFLTLNFNHRVLYAPSDFKDETNFIDLAVPQSKQVLPEGEKREEIRAEVHGVNEGSRQRKTHEIRVLRDQGKAIQTSRMGKTPPTES